MDDRKPETLADAAPPPRAGVTKAQVRAQYRPRTWACFEQHVLRGRPGAEVAAELGLTANTVTVNASRVLARLGATAGRAWRNWPRATTPCPTDTQLMPAALEKPAPRTCRPTSITAPSAGSASGGCESRSRPSEGAVDDPGSRAVRP